MLGLVSPVPASAAATNLPTFGVQFHGTWEGYTDEAKQHVLRNLYLAGAETVRIDVSWAMLEPERSGQLSPWGEQRVDEAIRAAEDNGLRPLVMFWLAPSWANDSSDERVAPTSAEGLAGLRSITERMAAKYDGVVEAWQVWNEPNSDTFLRGADPEVYAAVLTAAHAGFKAGDPDTTVVFGGPSYVDAEWVHEVFHHAGVDDFDVMSVHPYMGVADEAPEAPDNGTMWRLNHLPALLDVMARHGVGDRDVWFTEFGWQVGRNDPDTPNWQRGVTAAQQADYLQRTVNLVRAVYPQVTRVYWYQDRADSMDRADSGFGLVLPDGTGTSALRRAASMYVPGLDPAVFDQPMSTAESAQSIAQQAAHPYEQPDRRQPLPVPSGPLFVSVVPLPVRAPAE